MAAAFLTHILELQVSTCTSLKPFVSYAAIVERDKFKMPALRLCTEMLEFSLHIALLSSRTNDVTRSCKCHLTLRSLRNLVIGHFRRRMNFLYHFGKPQ